MTRLGVLGVSRERTENLAAPVLVGGPPLSPSRWLRRLHDRELARAVLVAEELGAIMQFRPGAARRSRDYAAEYRARVEGARRRAAAAGLPPPTARAAAGHGTRPVPRGTSDLFRASPRQAEARKRARRAVSLAREHGWSLSRAAREAHTTPDNVRRWAPSAIGERGRVKAGDIEVRIVPFVSGGVVYPKVAVRGSRQARLVSGYLRAVNVWLKDGDDEPLSHFSGVVVTGTLPDGRRLAFELEVDAEVLDALAAEGELDELVVPS